MRIPRSGEFLSTETHGFVDLESSSVSKTSAGLGWPTIYLSIQSEVPYAEEFEAKPDIFIGVLKSGFVRASIDVHHALQKISGAPGSVSIVPNGIPFGVYLQSDIETLHFYLRRSVLDEVAKSIYHGDPGTIELATRLAVPDPTIEQLCHAAGDALDADPQASMLYTEHIAYAVAGHLIRKHSDAGSRRLQSGPNGGLSNRQFARTKESIEANLDRSLSVADLAADVGMSADHFGRLFKKQTGMAVYQFVIRCRVERACRLLAETDTPISAIAHECGFADQVHLTRTFRRVIGVTPAVFRRESQK